MSTRKPIRVGPAWNSSTCRTTDSRHGVGTPRCRRPRCHPCRKSPAPSRRRLTGKPWRTQPARLGARPALHRLEPGEQVLEHPRLDIVGAGLAVRGRRALVEEPRVAAVVCSRLRSKTRSRSQRASTPCSSAGRSTWAGSWRMGGLLRRVVLRRRDERLRPRYHPPCTGRPAAALVLRCRRLHEADVHGRAGPRARTVPGSPWLLAALLVLVLRRPERSRPARPAAWTDDGAGGLPGGAHERSASRRRCVGAAVRLLRRRAPARLLGRSRTMAVGGGKGARMAAGGTGIRGGCADCSAHRPRTASSRPTTGRGAARPASPSPAPSPARRPLRAAARAGRGRAAPRAVRASPGTRCAQAREGRARRRPRPRKRAKAAEDRAGRRRRSAKAPQGEGAEGGPGRRRRRPAKKVAAAGKAAPAKPRPRRRPAKAAKGTADERWRPAAKAAKAAPARAEDG